MTFYKFLNIFFFCLFFYMLVRGEESLDEFKYLFLKFKENLFKYRANNSPHWTPPKGPMKKNK